MLLAVTWPGLVPFSRIRPFVFGLPFSMAWIAAWIAGSIVVLYVLDLVERRYRSDEDGVGEAAAPPAGSHPSGPGTDAGHGGQA